MRHVDPCFPALLLILLDNDPSFTFDSFSSSFCAVEGARQAMIHELKGIRHWRVHADTR